MNNEFNVPECSAYVRLSLEKRDLIANALDFAASRWKAAAQVALKEQATDIQKAFLAYAADAQALADQFVIAEEVHISNVTNGG